MRAVCLALFLTTITFSSGCIPVDSSGRGKKAEAQKIAVEEPPKVNVEAPANELPAMGEEKAPEAPLKAAVEKPSKEELELEARAKFNEEMTKWMAGETSSATSIRYIQSRPLKHEILSVIFDPAIGLPADFPPGDRIAYRFNVSVTFESEVGTLIQKVLVYQVSMSQRGEWSVYPEYK
ncbi:MAG TPA: hypothetical protein VNQ76_17610 [Planctomicrobium sp.]|nr:hypothetical protein [Planctomicrobium sp.]